MSDPLPTALESIQDALNSLNLARVQFYSLMDKNREPAYTSPRTLGESMGTLGQMTDDIRYCYQYVISRLGE